MSMAETLCPNNIKAVTLSYTHENLLYSQIVFTLGFSGELAPRF